MTTYLIYTAVAGAFAIGVGLGVLLMCLVAMGKLGDDPLPEEGERIYAEPVAFATKDFSDVVLTSKRAINSKAFCVPLYKQSNVNMPPRPLMRGAGIELPEGSTIDDCSIQGSTHGNVGGYGIRLDEHAAPVVVRQYQD